ncbi:hypothetical protein [Actinoplanes regularis]|uniref:hypothetical protein n=1 Tax=Actinoplanes regularis TaxID=52697 RepID=UPI0024A5A580|nr:hypothetical protein [Actinoplanes regularis]GLW35141.1 hypothetical protein Areg01_80770 [Actinoplanes regularis]
MPLSARVAGALVLLYGVRATTMSALTTAHLSHRANGTYLNLGGTLALLPPSLARLIDNLVDQPRRFDGIATSQEQISSPVGFPAGR